MGTLTADCPQLDAHCPHKLATSCRLTSTLNCCACADERVHSRTYRVYIDGIGFVQRGTRWQGYCWFCKEFWTNRLASTDPPLEISQTRIPEIPDQTEFLDRWCEFHQGYRVAKLPDGTEQRMPVIGEPFKEVSPGFLPRTLDQLRAGVENDARRPENRLRRRRLTSEEERPAVPQQSLDSALDSLLAEAEDEDTPQALQEPAPVTVQAPQEARESAVISDIVGPSQSPNPPQLPSRIGPRLERRARERLRFQRLFGTAEDVQQDDYQSPLSTMYDRAYDRYNQAEERRATDTTAPPPLDGLSERERRDIEEQLLWGVMRESANEEGNVWSYTPRRLQTGAPPRLPLSAVPTSHGFDTARATARAGNQRSQRLVMRRWPESPLTAATQTPYPGASASSSNAAQSEAYVPSPSGSPADAVPNLASVAMLLRHQARCEAMLAERRAEFDRLRPDAQPPNASSLQDNNQHGAIAGPSQQPASSPLRRDEGANGMTQIQSSIQQITSELQRLRLASEAITTARQSMHPHFQHSPEPPPQTLDNQPGRPSAMSDEEMTKKLECQVCYQQLADIAVLPCGHMVMCQWCADVVIPVKHTHLPIRPSKCPMCRKTVKQRFKIHMG
ncbi:hypothetical protein DE146DRAFT_712668 [Phaeosphaeria sp. MPI-PUGE-AT-0046c]|nr:hypothetical protein DE146DRAFT_712668 [Phaeosphaeria sp. MPI-PUGE-AT-0046c]